MPRCRHKWLGLTGVSKHPAGPESSGNVDGVGGGKQPQGYGVVLLCSSSGTSTTQRPATCSLHRNTDPVRFGDGGAWGFPRRHQFAKGPRCKLFCCTRARCRSWASAPRMLPRGAAERDGPKSQREAGSDTEETAGARELGNEMNPSLVTEKRIKTGIFFQRDRRHRFSKSQ